ncbi:TIGR00153 family protein [Dongshaea marina]|uniref:TIGR00153 family protein n=1 Tax=Dongshaea marina TaxID=2047966 RepID=UPI000D3E5738|nr:TIGR00153 family protein [Dongshaea marina]
MPVNTVLGLFARSPIKPLEKHISKVEECCELLIPFFVAAQAKNWEQAEQLRLQISELEKQADHLKRELRLKLPRGLFMPVERGDMLELLTQQDKIANKAKDIAGRVVGRHLLIPEVMASHFSRYLRRCLDATAQACRVINELDSLLETGFLGREMELVTGMIDELDRIEDDTDLLQAQLCQQLHQIESDLNPIDVMFLYRILEWVGDLADQALRVGVRLELMIGRS